MDWLILDILFLFLYQSRKCQTFRQALVGLGLALVTAVAVRTDVVLPAPFHLATPSLGNANTLAMEPVLTTVTADHEPRVEFKESR